MTQGIFNEKLIVCEKHIKEDEYEIKNFRQK